MKANKKNNRQKYALHKNPFLVMYDGNSMPVYRMQRFLIVIFKSENF